MAARRSSSPAPCPMRTARRTSATWSRRSRPTSGCAASASRGHECIYVCADDTHGTPIMLKARGRGHRARGADRAASAPSSSATSPTSASASTTTTPRTPRRTARLTVRIYERARAAGHIRAARVRQAYDERRSMFLPDRYVTGTCPRCSTPDQYGDSCEICGATYTPSDLIDPSRSLRHAPGRARVGALLLQARQLRADAARSGRARARCRPRSRTSSTSGSRRGCATGTSRATRPTSASRSRTRRASTSTSGSTRRSATWRASRTSARARGLDFDGLVEAGQPDASCTTSSARTSSTSTRCSGRRCSRARASASRRPCTRTAS